jgi:integrase
MWRSVLPPTGTSSGSPDQDYALRPHNQKRNSARAVAVQVRQGTRQGGEANDHLSDQAIYNIVVERAAEAKLKNKLTPHDFRRNHIGDMLSRGIDLSIAQDLAGHADPKTTKNYDGRREAVQAEAAAKLDAPQVRWQPGVPRRQARKQTVKSG